MAENPHLDPSSFRLEGGAVGVMLVHGFTGSPPEMRLVGDYLHQRGFTVSGPRLPGHGTTVGDLNRRGWTDWTHHVAEVYADLQSRCRTVFVGGLSLGSLLTLYLAAHYPELAGALVYSPPLKIANWRTYLVPVLKYLMPQLPKPEDHYVDPQAGGQNWSYETYPLVAAHEVMRFSGQVRRLLPQVTCPLLVVHSTQDRDLHPNSAQITYERASSRDKEMVTLHDSGHVVTIDGEWESVAETTYQFILKRLPAASEAGQGQI